MKKLLLTLLLLHVNVYTMREDIEIEEIISRYINEEDTIKEIISLEKEVRTDNDRRLRSLSMVTEPDQEMRQRRRCFPKIEINTDRLIAVTGGFISIAAVVLGIIRLAT